MNKKITIDVPEELIPLINNTVDNIISAFNCNACNAIKDNNNIICNASNASNNTINAEVYNMQASNNAIMQYKDYAIPTIEEVVNYIKANNWENSFDAVAWFEYWNEHDWTDKSKGRIRRWTRMLDYSKYNDSQFSGKTVYPKEEEHIPLPKTVRLNRQPSIRRLT